MRHRTSERRLCPEAEAPSVSACEFIKPLHACVVALDSQEGQEEFNLATQVMDKRLEQREMNA
eukprot:3523864-Rhodomonas_salina.2